ncbi:hypothetical protein THASP1DRAFT_30876 [Thamnocephalis sphaerospora]|uniref:Uncharacterized protein n=1 Tax=Thamnocephalis sphaerospora TaxID=78915 RepID=A0A4P9XNA3_9FUNG|nr:hypothetical protein THASP1DRAFT_30876 [Thamnocephalis sphaerospora]|eukprot:RKP07302.1 hypothetical protein THASP1DRAFT_30876 [Thamnocephalis sphaerospora]
MSSNKATFIEEEDEGFDLQLLSIYLMGIAAVIGLLYWAKNKYLPAVKPAPVKVSASAAPKDPKELDLDWIPPHHLQNQRGSSRSPKPRKRKN